MLFPLQLQVLSFPKIIHIEEWYGPAVISLDINLGGKCSSVVQFQLPGALLSKDDISEVNFILDNTNKRFLTSADQWYFDDACLWQNWEIWVDVNIQLWGEGNLDGRGETCRHPSRWGVDDVEEIFYFVL